MHMMDLVRGTPLQDIAEKGSAIYSKIRVQFEPKENGKFLAIEPASEKTYLGNTSAEALEKARTENQGKVFYVVKVGFDAAETLAHTLFGRS